MNRIIRYDESSKISVDSIEGLQISFKGDNNNIYIHKNIKRLEDCMILCKNNNYIKIEETDKIIKQLNIFCRDNQSISIGKNFSCYGLQIDNYCESNITIVIGDDCLFSHGVEMLPSDGHTIYNQKTKDILNKPSKEIIIGNHVWVGCRCILLKDIKIEDNTIVGAGSIVHRGNYSKNSILAGNPARVTKENINWSFKNTDNFNKDLREYSDK